MNWLNLDFNQKENRKKLLKASIRWIKHKYKLNNIPIVKSFIIKKEGEEEFIDLSEEYVDYISQNEVFRDNKGNFLYLQATYIPVRKCDEFMIREGLEILARTDYNPSTRKFRNRLLFKVGNKTETMYCIHPKIFDLYYEEGVLKEVEKSEEHLTPEEVREKRISIIDYFYTLKGFIEQLIANGIMDSLEESYMYTKEKPTIMEESVRQRLISILIKLFPQQTLNFSINVLSLFMPGIFIYKGSEIYRINFNMIEMFNKLFTLIKRYVTNENIKKLEEIFYDLHHIKILINRKGLNNIEKQLEYNEKYTDEDLIKMFDFFLSSENPNIKLYKELLEIVRYRKLPSEIIDKIIDKMELFKEEEEEEEEY